MLKETTLHKLEILADAAKYDVSCASSGSQRPGTPDGLGNATGNGICHTFTPDGRCVSLLKLLLTNHCIYDCAYCVSRRSSDVRRAAFTVEEVVDLTVAFYRRNYIEGLFLSSGIFKSADATTERLVRVARTLRTEHAFHGFIHLKVIPGASPELIEEAGRWADRLSVNLEIPSEPGLQRVAPEKDYASALTPMAFLRDRIDEAQSEGKTTPRAPRFAPGGQSTQLVIGATDEDDRTVLTLADRLYRRERLRRVYYSGYVPVSADARVPQLDRAPVVREHRLYQADWLLRYYGYEADELVDEERRFLDLEADPKVAYALRHPYRFPVDVNTADRETLLRVPGVGVRSVDRILVARRRATLRWADLRKIGVVMKRARYFIDVPDHRDDLLERRPGDVRARLVAPAARHPPPATRSSTCSRPPSRPWQPAPWAVPRKAGEEGRVRVEEPRAGSLLVAPRRSALFPRWTPTHRPKTLAPIFPFTLYPSPFIPMQTFIYDGSWPGVLCALVAALRALGRAPGVPRPRIAAASAGGEGLFEAAVPVATDAALAARVRARLGTLGTPSTAERLRRAFLSEAPGVEDALLAYVEALRDHGRAVEADVLVPAVGAVDRLARATGREVHRMHAFVRFEAHAPAEGGPTVWRAVIEPACDVLPLLGDHFTARYPAQPWLILDARRRHMLCWQDRTLCLLAVPPADALRPTPDEALYQRLWQAYFTAVDIPERRNPALQQRHLPLRYRRHLTELRPRVGEG